MDSKEEIYKYVCDKCNFKCNAQSVWNIHTNTEKHKTGKNKKRCDFEGPHKCDKCKYVSINKINFLQHKLKHHATKEDREKEYKFYCKVCDYGTFSNDFFEKHNSSTKHQKMIDYNK
jgi:hypothetical protein